ncbi:MAG: HD domain-containing protein [Syntrophaceae bacterium]|nr:HD domain-containing protein [Syntrophaceae bacterium]
MDQKELKREILSDPFLSKLSSLAKEMGVPLFLVGGYIRDLFFGLESRDYDLALPEEHASFTHVIEDTFHLHFFKIGKEEMGTVAYRAIKEEISIDLTLFKEKTVEEDLERRDFTLNATAFSLRDETFHSVEGALEDIDKRVIRTVSEQSIDRDPLRMLRAIRYLCTLDGLLIDLELKEEICQKKEKIQDLPGERIRMELDQILLSRRPGAGIRALYELGLLFVLMPELKGLENLGQNEHHHLDVLSHTFLTIEKISWAMDWIVQNGRRLSLSDDDRLSLYYASLFHDIGKQDSYSKDEKGRVHFYYHEARSSQKAEQIMERLRFSNSMMRKVLRLIENHMRILNLSRETKETALKRLVNQISNESPLLVVLTLADKEASRGVLSIQIDEVVENHCLRVLDLFEEKDLVHPPPLITGHDVMALGYRSGPRVGQILSFIREKQVEGEIRTREEALEILRQRFGQSGEQ